MTGVKGTTRWTVETTLTSATFTVRHLGFRTVTGTVPVTDARIQVDTDGHPLRIEADLDPAGLDTGNRRRDRDLCAPGLLDTARHPRLTFRGDATTGTTVPGVLHVRGRDVPVELEVSGDASHAVATTSFDRTTVGIRAPRLLIGRMIEVRIDAVLRPA